MVKVVFKDLFCSVEDAFDLFLASNSNSMYFLGNTSPHDHPIIPHEAIRLLTKIKIHIVSQLCGNGPGFCCIAEDLDNPFVIDFGQGQLSSFTGEVLQECNNYELGSNINWETGITLYHKGLY